MRKCLYEFIAKKKAVRDWMDGSRIHKNPSFLCLEKRISGSGGYRIYYILTIHNDEITLAALYPKFGTKGATDLNDEGKTRCIKEALKEIQEQCRWQIITVLESESIDFKVEEKKLVKKS